MTFGAYLTSQWLPAKQLQLATSTFRGYERNVRNHILPALGRISIRRLRYQQIESLYDSLLRPDNGRGLAPKTVYELHLIIRGSLTDAHRRGLGHAHIVHTLQTYQHVLPGMQDDAAGVAERLANPNPNPTGKKKPTKRSRETAVERRGNNRKNAA